MLSAATPIPNPLLPLGNSSFATSLKVGFSETCRLNRLARQPDLFLDTGKKLLARRRKPPTCQLALSSLHQ